MDNHDMSEARADEFMKWRYRHMNVGAKFELKDGKLDIPGFADDSQLDKFKSANPDITVDEVDKKILAQANQDIVDREINLKESPVTVSEGPVGAGTVDLSNVIDTGPQVDAEVTKNIDEIYKRWGSGDQRYEWDVMKGRNAQELLDGKYGNPIIEGADHKGVEVDLKNLPEAERGSMARNPLDQAEINNREELRKYLEKLRQETGYSPGFGESVEDYVKWAERNKIENPK
jgi:hypothetical protein